MAQTHRHPAAISKDEEEVERVEEHRTQLRPEGRLVRSLQCVARETACPRSVYQNTKHTHLLCRRAGAIGRRTRLGVPEGSFRCRAVLGLALPYQRTVLALCRWETRGVSIWDASLVVPAEG